MAMLRLVGRRAELDLLRVVAIVGVVALHNFYDWEPTTLAIAIRFQQMAGLSVLLFFFLSGLLSRPADGHALVVRLRRSAELLLAWLAWGIAYILLGAVAQKLHLLPPIRRLFSEAYPFFSFAYQLYFLVVLAVLIALQALWLALGQLLGWSARSQTVLELLLATALLALVVRIGWPLVPHGHFLSLYPLYGLAYLAGVLQARGRRFAFALSLLTAAACLLSGTIAASAWFLIVTPLFTFLLGRLLRGLPQRLQAPIALVSACSGAIFLLHHPLLMPLARRFWRLFGLPDLLNYLLCMALACALPILLVLLLRPWLFRCPWLPRLLLVQRNVFHPTP
ncbi:acyltransferase family protein [Synechococcus sp. CBW1107]|uniref:acyltransferase family protein n=1 Tax=Synechococcus sp. CBW1107 TaxID=2789857 RepID=UPI002AD49281|nr:acyltransferase family protein [Synechococcus sp. CBW1107]CAK6696865.1 hypothetical protein IFHNHDMJ_02112 [Synechococcus sp. CBW1107]